STGKGFPGHELWEFDDDGIRQGLLAHACLPFRRGTSRAHSLILPSLRLALRVASRNTRPLMNHGRKLTYAHSGHFPPASDHVQFRVLSAQERRGVGRAVRHDCPLAGIAAIVRVGDVWRGRFDTETHA